MFLNSTSRLTNAMTIEHEAAQFLLRERGDKQVSVPAWKGFAEVKSIPHTAMDGVQCVIGCSMPSLAVSAEMGVPL